jgi:hypothetical protein
MVALTVALSPLASIYPAPSGRIGLSPAVVPARWAGLRNLAPLVRETDRGKLFSHRERLPRDREAEVEAHSRASEWAWRGGRSC